MADKHPGGRPPEYGPHVLDKLTTYFDNLEPWYDIPVEKQDKEGNVTTTMQRQANTPPTYRTIAKHLGVTRDTIWDWRNNHQEFCDLIEKHLPDVRESFVSENGLLGQYNAAFAKFYAQNKLGWTDKSETKSEVTVNLPKEITINLVRPK